jgi:hypothetical protein
MLRRAAASGREGCSAAPRLGLKANAFSGNQQRGGRALGTFNPLFPRLNVEGQFIVPSNLLEPYPSVTVEDRTLLVGKVDRRAGVTTGIASGRTCWWRCRPRGSFTR